VELSRKKFARIGEGILPSLLQSYQHVWYFCGNPEVYQTVIAARRDYLQTNEERKRIRILLLEEQIAEELLDWVVNRDPGAKEIIATDNDRAGKVYAEQIYQMRPNAVRDRRMRGKDWNDTLCNRDAQV